MSGRGWERKVQGRPPTSAASAVMTLLKHTTFPFISLSFSSTHARTHTLGNSDAPSTRKETEIGNKDHPLCLRTVNGGSNVFNLSPESSNRAHSTPADTVALFTYKLLDSVLPPSLIYKSSLFLIPPHSAHERIHLWDKATGVVLRRGEELWIEERSDAWRFKLRPLVLEWHPLKAASFIHTV